MRKNFEKAIEDFEQAIKIDPSDPFNIKNDLALAKRADKEHEKMVQQKMQGFLLRDN